MPTYYEKCFRFPQITQHRSRKQSLIKHKKCDKGNNTDNSCKQNEIIQWDFQKINNKTSKIHIELQDDILYLTGHINMIEPWKGPYIKIATLNKNYVPRRKTVIMQPMKGEWGDIRLQISDKDQTISVKPALSFWLNCAIPIEFSHGFCFANIIFISFFLLRPLFCAVFICAKKKQKKEKKSDVFFAQSQFHDTKHT